MALKQVVDTTKNTYLTKRFEDDEGNQYGDAAVKSLIAWFRLSDTPKDLSSSGLILAYEGSPPPSSFTNQKIGDVVYPAATFSNANNDKAKVTSSKFSFSTISEEVTVGDIAAGGIAGTDLPFTFSMWVKITQESDTEILFTKRGNVIEYTASYASSDKFKISLHGANSNTIKLEVETSEVIPGVVGNWTHVAFTYTGGTATSSGGYAEQAIKIYVNGDLQKTTGSVSGTYLSTAPYRDQPLYIGANFGGVHELDGDMAEFAVWSTDLSAENIKAIYNTSKSRFTRNQAISGFLNHSPRIQSIENINYHDIHGKFDDTRTIDFIDPRQVAVLKIKKRPGDAKTITITDPHDDPGDSASSASKTFEFQRGVILNAGNVEINIRDAKTPAQVARKIVSAINSASSPGVWSFTATQTKPDEVTITRGKIDGASACTVSTSLPERFIEITQKFKKQPQPVTVYPSLEIADSNHLLERKRYGHSVRSDIEIVRPVSRVTPLRPKTVHATSPFNEAHAHSAFGFEEGIESVSPEKDLDSDFYVSGSASAIAPESIRNRKKIVLDMPVSQNTDLQLVTNSDRSETNSNFPMAYYNFTDKSWQKIGLGSGSFAAAPAGSVSERQAQFNQALDFTMVGFTPSKGLKAWRVTDRQGVSATATITVAGSNSFRTSGTTTAKLTIQTISGVNVVASAHATTTTNTDTNTPTFQVGASAAATATNIATCLNANSNLSALTDGGTTITVAQNLVGTDGALGNGLTITVTGKQSDNTTDATSSFPTISNFGGGGPERANLGFEANGIFDLSPTGSLAFRNGSTQNPRVLSVGSLASPTNVFGFPAHPKFHANDSQELSISNHITKPFVLEKIVYEFNVGMKSSSVMSTLSSDTNAADVSVDFDTITFFMLNQREAAVGKELSEVPSFRVADSNSQKSKLSEVIAYTNPICPAGKEIPRKIQLTPHNVSGSEAHVGETEVSTIRDLVTWSRLTSSPSGFNTVYLDAFAKDVRKDSDLVLTPDDNTYPFGSSRKISYTGQPSDGDTIKLVSSDGTIRTYEFDGDSSHTSTNVRVVIGGNADATYAALKTAVLSASGHNGKILVTHDSVAPPTSGDIVFHMGPKKYSIAAECIAPVVQITSGSIPVGAAALGSIDSASAYFGITNTTPGAASKPPNNVIDTSPPTGQTIALSKVSIGRTLVGIQSGRSLLGENPSSKRLYTFRGLKNGDAKITAYEKDFGASPYVILPTDKLVIGCQAPINSTLDGVHPEIRLGSGDGRIILYGYELEKEHPSYRDFSKDSTANSSFLSEDVGDISTRDEFETHPRMTYYRSSIDEVVTGSMLPDRVGDDFNTQTQAFARKVVGRNSQGTQGEAGSLLRARKLQDRSERYFDSMTPDIRDLMNSDSVNSLDISGLRTAGVILGVAGSDAAYKSLVGTGVPGNTKVIWDNWFSSFPFEPRYRDAARLESVRRDIPTKVQTGANKQSTQKTSIDHVSLALFESTGTLGVTGMVNGVYTTTGILDNPTENENTNRLVPLGRSSGMFINSPPINMAEVFATWTAQDIAATGSIEISKTGLVSKSALKSLNMKTLSVPFLGTGQTTTVSENFVFAHLDKQTNELFYPGTSSTNHKLGEVKVAVGTSPVLTVSYDDSVQVSDFANMLIQVPSTGSAPSSSALKLFLDSAGTDPTGNKSTSTVLDSNTHVNKGSLSAMGTSDTVLNDMWTTGSVVQLSKTAAATDIVDKTGTVVTSGGVAINTPILLFNDRAGNEAQRFIDLDRLVNSYDKDDRTQTGTASLTAIPVDNEMSLTFKHARGVNTNVHATLNEPPDGDEDIQVQLSYGVAATANIYVESRTENASSSKTPEKGAITITSTDGTVRKYVITDTIAGGSGGGVATGTRLISTTDTGTGQAGTDNVGAIAVGINITGSSTLSTRQDYLEQLRTAITHANGHGSKINVSAVTVDGDNAYITLTQSKAGPSGNTTIVKSVEATNIAATSTAFSGGSTRNETDFAVWGNKIDHTNDSRAEGFISNDFRLGHSIKINVNGFGRKSDDRCDAFTNSSAGTRFLDAPVDDVIKFSIDCTESGQVVARQYQFYPVDDSGGLTPTFTYNNSGVITDATANMIQQQASEVTFTYAFKSGVANGADDPQNLTNDLARARKLAEAINAASRFEDQSGHEKGRFCALVSQDSSNTYINIYFTSFGIGQSAVATPDLAEFKTKTNGGSALNTAVGVGAGRADDVFVSINQTAASFTDSYAFANIQLSADLDPAEEFLTYTDHETNTGGGADGPKKNHIVAVNISGATNVDEVYAEIAAAINITTATNSDAIKTFDGMIVASHDIAANTLALTYNVPVRVENYKHVLNKVLLPLPGARYNFIGLQPTAAQHTHRLIPISDITPVSTAYQPLTTRLNTVFTNTTAAITIDGSSWGYAGFHQITNGGEGGDNNNILLTQQEKGIAGNQTIVSTADTALITTVGFRDGESSIYGDGDNIPEPLDADPNSYSSLEVTCEADNEANGQTFLISIGGVSYSGTMTTTRSSNNSTATQIGINDVGSTDATLAAALKKSLETAFASQIQSQKIKVETKSGNANVIVISAKNSFHIQAATPIPTGTALEAPAAFSVTGWSGADLVKIKGSLLKRKAVQKGVFENDPEDVDTVQFASIIAKDVPGEVRSDSLDQVFELGSFLKRSRTDYFSKVFFGTGDGPAKAPRHKITEKSNLVLALDKVQYKVVTHSSGGASAVDTSNFTLTGVAPRPIISAGSGHNFQSGDNLLGFTGAGTRRMDLDVEIQAGETVEVRFAAASFWYGVDTTGGGQVPQVVSAEGVFAEKADNGDDGVHVRVSVDGGASYSDVHEVFPAQIDGTATSSSSLFRGSSEHPVKSSNFGSGADETSDTHEQVDGSTKQLANIGGSRYPIFKFTATSTCKLRLEQPRWSSQSVSFDHWWFRYLLINVAPPPGDGEGSVAVSGRGNYNQTASASEIEIRGAKYGLISPVKLNTSAIFRAGSFGQVRDMLEQRPLTRTFDGQRVSESPVAVSFQERRSKRPISPEETNSANLDIFCTSSLPYFDGLTKDRASQQPDLVDEIDVDITV